MIIEYSEPAVNDLIRLREFIARENPLAAKHTARTLLLGIEKLKIFPRMGLAVTHSPQPEIIRDLFITHYTVRYLLQENNIFILRIWHDKEAGRNI